MRSADTTAIVLSILLDILLTGAPVTVYVKKFNGDFTGDCGIPLRMWLFVNVILIAVSILQKLILLTIVRCCRKNRFIYSIISTGIVYFAMCTWLFYGNIIFYSKANDCTELPETKALAHLMLFFLSIGYIPMIYAVVYAVLLPQAVMKYLFLRDLD